MSRACRIAWEMIKLDLRMCHEVHATMAVNGWLGADSAYESSAISKYVIGSQLTGSLLQTQGAAKSKKP